jgi:D-beta-D-heptose 7-phosphate kinase/D-beta-D-heptose 1-phosphate adenosyltransferase
MSSFSQIPTQIPIEIPWHGRTVKVAIIGDIILDEYLNGSVARISPEAPVPVHLVEKIDKTAGGAANVARNIKLVGGEPVLLSTCGDDKTADELLAILAQDKISADSVIRSKDLVTVRKTRVTANNQHIVRIDWEKVSPISEKLQNQLIANLEKQDVQAILISDYAKGCLPNTFVMSLIEVGRKKQVPVIVDPKGKDYARYQGAFVVTPNRAEACEALGLNPLDQHDPAQLAEKIALQFKIQNVLITLGPLGMLLYETASKKSIHIPTRARNVFDVSGAGDTVAGIVALSLAAGESLQRAMHLGNLAAGRVVEKWGTQPILKSELEEELHRERSAKIVHENSSAKKILKVDQLQAKLKQSPTQISDVVFTNGCFDILHAGHVTYLEKAKALGEILIVGLNSDASVKRLKGSARPVIGENQRALLIAALQCVDYVVVFEDDTPLNLIQSIRPGIIVKGADWAESAVVGGDFVKSYGGQVKTIDLVPGISTTEVISRIKS